MSVLNGASEMHNSTNNFVLKYLHVFIVVKHIVMEPFSKMW